MTFRELMHKHCTDRGMFESQAKAVVASIADDPKHTMRDRFDGDAFSYPPIIANLMRTEIDREALKWIDANLPEASYRYMFESKATG